MFKYNTKSMMHEKKLISWGLLKLKLERHLQDSYMIWNSDKSICQERNSKYSFQMIFSKAGLHTAGW